MAFFIKNIKVNNIISINELSIPSQKVTCVVGQSGSGKSTFMRLLNHLESPDTGDIFYEDENLQTLDPVVLRRKVTMVPQSPVIYEGTIKDNLLIGRKFAGMDIATDSQMNECLQLVKLDKQLITAANDLSGGEKQRLALARALLLDADTFLLDEPSSSLDNETAFSVIEAFMKHMRKLNKTVIMVTHDKELAGKIGDNMIYMDNYSKKISDGDD